MLSSKLQLTLRDRKVLAAIFTLIMVTSLFSVLIGYQIGVDAQSSALTMQTNSGGIYPGAPSCSVFTDGSTYYAKNSYGSIISSGTNAAAVINQALATATGMVEISAGEYNITTSLLFPNNVGLEGPKFGTYTVGCATLNLVANTNLISQVGTHASHLDGLVLSNLRLTGNGYAGDAIHLEYVSDFIINNVVVSNFDGSALYIKEAYVGATTNFKHDGCGSVSGSKAAIHIISAEDATSDLTFNKLIGADWSYMGLILGTPTDFNVNANNFFGIQYEGRTAYNYTAVFVNGALNTFSGGSIAYIPANTYLVTIAGDLNTFTGVNFYNTLAQNPAIVHITSSGGYSVIVGCGFAYASATSASAIATVGYNGGITDVVVGETKTLFIPVTYTNGTMGIKGTYGGAILADGIDECVYANFVVPLGFLTLSSIKVILIPNGTGNIHHIATANYGGNGESFTVNSATVGDFVTGLTSGTTMYFDLYGDTLFANLAVGDNVGIQYTRWGTTEIDTVGASVVVAGFIFTYTT